MAIFSFWTNKSTKTSASSAKDRLQIIIARERTGVNEYDFMPKLQEEIIAVIAKYIKVPAEDIKLSMNKNGEVEVLDVNVTLPPGAPA